MNPDSGRVWPSDIEATDLILFRGRFEHVPMLREAAPTGADPRDVPLADPAAPGTLAGLSAATSPRRSA